MMTEELVENVRVYNIIMSVYALNVLVNCKHNILINIYLLYLKSKLGYKDIKVDNLSLA